ncbi:MAG TPA: DUF3137 domain-containing protein [Mobilitalea sp.]|nr:DUF3137 domain-containing protein [Mobilitalea sp.]
MEDSILSLEKLRKKAATLLIIIVTISIAATLIFLFVFSALGMERMGTYLSVLLGAGIGYLLSVVTGFFHISEEYKARFKATFVEIPLRNTFSQVIYYADQGIEEDVIKETGIMSLGNRYTSNDYVRGYYKDVKFERADVKIQQHYNTGKSSYTVTYLHGRWLIFEFNKNFHFDLQIIGNEFPHSLKKNSIFTESEERRHRIQLEDIEFHEMFDVLCQNEHEAYYILTPQFMSVLKDINSTMDGSIMLGFIDNKLHVAIHNEKDSMEPRIFNSINLSAVKEEVQQEINVILNIIDGLNLDRDIYENR